MYYLLSYNHALFTVLQKNQILFCCRVIMSFFFFRKLGTAAPYGCNDKIDSVGNLTSPKCSSVNVMRLFGSSQRRKRSHGHRHYNCLNFHADVTFETLLPYVQQPLGLHHIRTKLYQLPVTKLRSLQKEVVDTKTFVQNSSKYKLVAIILDVAKLRLYKPVQTVSPEETPTRDFLKLDFKNKGLDAINISNILNHRKVTSTIPAHFKCQSPPIISYSYSSPIAPKIFNYKNMLQGLNTENITRNPSACSCKASELCYNPAGHIITVDLNIVRISKLRDILSKGSKYRETEFQINFVVCLTLCHFVLMFFSPFSIAITSLGEERANLSAFRMFDRFVLVWICRFPLPLDVWEGLRFVIVALPGFFSYLFYVVTGLPFFILHLSY